MTSQHRYGPHQPELAPNVVTILTGGTQRGRYPDRWPRTELVPMPDVALRQREQLNTRAHRAACPSCTGACCGGAR